MKKSDSRAFNLYENTSKKYTSYVYDIYLF